MHMHVSRIYIENIYDCRATELGTDIWNIRSFPFNLIFILARIQ